MSWKEDGSARQTQRERELAEEQQSGTQNKQTTDSSQAVTADSQQVSSSRSRGPVSSQRGSGGSGWERKRQTN